LLLFQTLLLTACGCGSAQAARGCRRRWCMEGGAIDLNMAPTSDEEEEERQESAVDTLRRVS